MTHSCGFAVPLVGFSHILEEVAGVGLLGPLEPLGALGLLEPLGALGPLEPLGVLEPLGPLEPLETAGLVSRLARTLVSQAVPIVE